MSAGLCFSAIVFARTWTHLRESQIIDVTGSARKNVRSDLVIWRGHFNVEDSTLLGANTKLQSDTQKVETFLRAKGAKNFTLEPLQIHEVTARQKNEDEETVSRRLGYALSQVVEVRSADVEATPRLSRECTELLAQGIALVSDGVQYIYTNAGLAKIEMMADATRDARARADQIASQGNRAVKELRSARMGVVQINPIYSTATSWEGNNDISSLEKTLTVTVAAEFALK